MNVSNTIGFGCVGLSAQPFESDALKLLDVAFDEGITHFDTAPLYGKGFSEKILGKFLKQHRSKVTVTSKFGLGNASDNTIPVWLALPMNKIIKTIRRRRLLDTEFQEPNELSYRKIELNEVRKSFENSIRNLKVDHIDHYLLHEAVPSFLTEEALQYIYGLKQKGHVKKIGIATSYCNFKDEKTIGYPKWDVLQYENSILQPSDNYIDIFPDRDHIYHSVLKPLKYKKVKDSFKKDIAGIMLARAFKNNIDGKILFSTSKPAHIKTNLQNMARYTDHTIAELGQILLNAFH